MVSRKRDREHIGEDLDEDGCGVDAPFNDEAAHHHHNGAEVDGFDPNVSSFSLVHQQPAKQRRLLSSLASASASSSSSLSTVFPFLAPASAPASAPAAAAPGTESLWSTIPPEWHQATGSILPAPTKKKRSWSPDLDALSGSEQSQTSSTSIPSSDDLRDDGGGSGGGPSKRTRLLSSLSAMSLGKAPTSSSGTVAATATATGTMAAGSSSSSPSVTDPSDAAVLTSKYVRVNHVGNTNESLVAMNEYLHQLHLERQLRRQHPPLWSTGHATTATHRPLPIAATVPPPRPQPQPEGGGAAMHHAMDEDPSPDEAMDTTHDDPPPPQQQQQHLHSHLHSHSHLHRHSRSHYRSVSP
eukprot:gene18060-12954_t